MSVTKKTKTQSVGELPCLQTHEEGLPVYSQRGQALTRLRVPELDGLLAVLATGDNKAFGGMPVNALDISTMP